MNTTVSTLRSVIIVHLSFQAVDIRQIYDKFPEKKGGLKELYDKGPQSAFFLVKFWVGKTSKFSHPVPFYDLHPW
jgi:hypothetical protein